jgi:hypothetical protein
VLLLSLAVRLLTLLEWQVRKKLLLITDFGEAAECSGIRAAALLR